MNQLFSLVRIGEVWGNRFKFFINLDIYHFYKSHMDGMLTDKQFWIVIKINWMLSRGLVLFYSFSRILQHIYIWIGEQKYGCNLFCFIHIFLNSRVQCHSLSLLHAFPFLKSSQTLAGVAQWIERGFVNQRVLVRFPVRAYAWVAGQIPSVGCTRGNHTLMFLSLSPSLPCSLKISKQNLLKK